MEADTHIADKAFDAAARVRKGLEAAAQHAVLPPRSNKINLREYDRDLYKARYLVENFFCKHKQFRAIATHCDKIARNFLPVVHLTVIVI
ncbi:MAG: transposase [Rhodospirillaceae bacterium]|nr:MAG: transposase [Rhodospirillaceae bacterium]